jgi:thymidylate synthase (FAD)
VFTFWIDGISRACLQELARHRIASLSVQSTRYCLGKQWKCEPPFTPVTEESLLRAQKYLVFSESEHVNLQVVLALEQVRLGATKEIPNDQLKMCLPENFKTRLLWTINARSLRNFKELRLAKRAHWEIRALAGNVLAAVAHEYGILFDN